MCRGRKWAPSVHIAHQVEARGSCKTAWSTVQWTKSHSVKLVQKKNLCIIKIFKYCEICINCSFWQNSGRSCCNVFKWYVTTKLSAFSNRLAWPLLIITFSLYFIVLCMWEKSKCMKQHVIWDGHYDYPLQMSEKCNSNISKQEGHRKKSWSWYLQYSIKNFQQEHLRMNVAPDQTIILGL